MDAHVPQRTRLGGMTADGSRALVVSSPSGRGLVLGVTFFFAVAMTIVTVYYSLHPDTTGPTATITTTATNPTGLASIRPSGRG